MVDVLDLKAMAQQAVGLHQQGNLVQAEALYLQILEADPQLFGPRYYLGILRLQQGRSPEATEYLAQALKIFPQDMGALMHHGMALQAAGRSSEALESFDRALAIQPNLPEAHYNRGVALAGLMQFERAVEAYDRALVLQPELMAALVNRGGALTALNRFDDALDSYQRVLTMQPGNVMALNNRGLALRQLGRLPEALQDYDRALALQPDFADAQYNRAVALLDLQRAGDALAAFEAVMPGRADDAELFNNRGVALWNLKRPAEALASYDRALAIELGFAQAWGNRGLALKDMGRLDEALASLDRVIALEPRNPVGWNSRGSVLRDLKRYDEAIESYGRAIDIRPDYAEALNNRGYSHWAHAHNYAAALADLERALAIDPDHPYARGEILHIKMYGADWSDFEKRKTDIEDAIHSGQRVMRPFGFQALSSSPEDLQACARIYARDLYAENPGTPHDAAARKAARKIRIGYVSADFRQQATAILMAGLYEAHDKDRFEIVALDNGAGDGSPMRARLEKAFDRWTNIAALSDEQAAVMIRSEEIDILVNLNGYFGSPRMGLFARRPAPVQVNYLGFPGTLGAPYMDYIVADKMVIPDGEEKFYDEQVAWLSGSYQANDNKGRVIAPMPDRAEAGLPDTGFVFCNFNQSYKLTPDTWAGWMRILKQVEGSVLWLLESRPPLAENLRRAAQAAGVAPERILFAPDLPTDQHYGRLQLADLFLDGLPYNAHTTASDALWAGVPLVTQRGTAFAGRVAASLLAAAGLPELIAESAAEFEALAIKLATDGKALKALRGKLAKNRDTCALFDTTAFARNIEAAYSQMWQTWLAGEKPKGFAVDGTEPVKAKKNRQAEEKA